MESAFFITNSPLWGGLFGWFESMNRFYFSHNAAWAAARRAIGTRNGEQLT